MYDSSPETVSGVKSVSPICTEYGPKVGWTCGRSLSRSAQTKTAQGRPHTHSPARCGVVRSPPSCW